MANVAVIGAQWGDEGKGKIVDWLSARADVVVRFQGGHNAGHTLVIDGVTYKLSLLPSGVVRPGKLSVIGNGVVVDPWALAAEIEKLRGQGVTVTPENLMVAENAALILPLHRELDVARESGGSVQAIGTTKRGIGPAYEDKVGRRAIRAVDLQEPRHPARQDRASPGPSQCAAARHRASAELSVEAVLAELNEIAPKVLPFIGPVWRKLDEARQRRQAHPVRGRAGGAARRRSRHLSLRHLVQHGGGTGGGRLGHRPAADRLCARHRQGLHHAGRRRPLPHRAEERDRRAASARAARNSEPSPGASGAAAGSMPCWCARPSSPAASTASR